MITVNEILNLTLLKKFELLSGKEYLSNAVTTVVILEYESSKIEFSGYNYGYFVLASYFFASSAPDFVNDSIRTLIKRHVSGIAIKISPEEKIPEELIELAKKEHVPLLTFYEEFMEDLIININESLKTRAQYIIHEEKLNKIMEEKTDKDKVRNIALEINPNFKSMVICANLISKEKSSNLKVHTFFDKFMYHRLRVEETDPWIFVKNNHDIILICSFNPEEIENLQVLPYIESILLRNGFSEDAFYIGFDATPVNIGELKESVIKAKFAATISQFENKNSLSYENSGIYKYIISLIKNEIMCHDIKNKIAILEEYDKVHESNLLNTLISYVKNNRDYLETSKSCFQHTNTIRYRIKKAQELLMLDEETADEEISILIRCYLLLNLELN